MYSTPNAGTSKASQGFWQVDGVDREIDEPKAQGVEFGHYADMPGERSTSTSDAVIASGAKAVPGSRTPRATSWR